MVGWDSNESHCVMWGVDTVGRSLFGIAIRWYRHPGMCGIEVPCHKNPYARMITFGVHGLLYPNVRIATELLMHAAWKAKKSDRVV
jgi:hypothetical protein